MPATSPLALARKARRKKESRHAKRIAEGNPITRRRVYVNPNDLPPDEYRPKEYRVVRR